VGSVNYQTVKTSSNVNYSNAEVSIWMDLNLSLKELNSLSMWPTFFPTLLPTVLPTKSPTRITGSQAPEVVGIVLLSGIIFGIVVLVVVLWYRGRRA